MDYSTGAQRYREADLGSMTKEKMIVLLYEKVVSDLQAARRAIVDDDRLEMVKRVNHSQRIIAELRNALDHSVGGEVSRNLESLYDYLFHEHLEILLDRSVERVDNCLTVIAPLLAAWRQIPAGTSAQASQEQVPGAPAGPTGPDPASPSRDDAESSPFEAGEPACGRNVDRSGLLSVSA